ncbi:MAG: hypothetical protein NZ899_02775 [Thermoguttaceae bacterium]|nr:hypothetical protein [Thermoguttaceae bacterium]MDW8079749.1 hypothetical protein [Thermoguttaceae bacterium]
MVTTHPVSLRWRELFRPGNITEETFQKAEKLLETLRPEDPLRHRLYQELQEIKRLHVQKKSARKQK